MVYTIGCVEDGIKYQIKSKTAYKAMLDLIKGLNTARRDDTVAIRKTETGNRIYCIHSGKTYVANLVGKKRSSYES